MGNLIFLWKQPFCALTTRLQWKNITCSVLEHWLIISDNDSKVHDIAICITKRLLSNLFYFTFIKAKYLNCTTVTDKLFKFAKGIVEWQLN